jgi:small nuclear ribonucleoprotein (snRNP)-like protein
MKEQQNKKRISVRLADGTTVKGNINIKTHTRLTDLLNSTDEANFAVVTDASVAGQPGKTIIVRKEQIVWVMPED